MQQRHDLLSHATTVAFSPARMLTSHLRARSVSATVVGAFLVIGTLVVSVTWTWWSVQRVAKPWNISVQSPPLKALDTMPIEAKVTYRGKRPVHDVRLRWVLPQQTVLVHSDKAILPNGEIILGDIRPGEEVVSRIAARFYTGIGRVALRIELLVGDTVLAGTEERLIESSALALGLPSTPFVYTNRFPFVLRNTSDRSLEDLEIDVKGGVMDKAQQVLHLPPREQLIVWVTPQQEEVTVAVRAQAVTIEERTLKTTLRTTQPEGITLLTQRNTSTTYELVYRAEVPGELMIQTATTTERRAISVGDHTVTFATSTDMTIAPLWKEQEQTIIGALWMRKAPKPLNAQAHAVFTSKSGDQLGTGPWPPRKDETTRYWVHVSVPARDHVLRSVQMDVRLPSQTVLTGNMILPQGGTLTNDRYVLDELPEEQELSVAFEVEMAPTKTPTILLGTTTVQAIDVAAQEVINEVLQEINIASPKL